jgi:hypothetical protein
MARSSESYLVTIPPDEQHHRFGIVDEGPLDGRQGRGSWAIRASDGLADGLCEGLQVGTRFERGE